ncbi:isoamylase early set domain-containing protein [Lacimicrobium alkaliphilum]|uniref:Glycoside hydrolase n=1 Tax=Lacimicrobium alkaliphilum TaxID=1526571 RepID=A0A0U2ZK43_9ALTE|nr:isoamylase early set domain-containing protein [Lacimicrobium alkaliphilum]ALS98700.1 glycoside hydrolase [Lacimicrobium alkaliphilum]
MSVKKQYLKSKPVCKVTFKLTKQEAKAAQTVRLLGDFNNWDTQAPPMKRLKNGAFTATLDLPKDSQYQFRYLLDDKEWENDWAADQYVPSPVSLEDNSVIRV